MNHSSQLAAVTHILSQTGGLDQSFTVVPYGPHEQEAAAEERTRITEANPGNIITDYFLNGGVSDEVYHVDGGGEAHLGSILFLFCSEGSYFYTVTY